MVIFTGALLLGKHSKLQENILIYATAFTESNQIQIMAKLVEYDRFLWQFWLSILQAPHRRFRIK